MGNGQGRSWQLPTNYNQRDRTAVATPVRSDRDPDTGHSTAHARLRAIL